MRLQLKALESNLYRYTSGLLMEMDTLILPLSNGAWIRMPSPTAVLKSIFLCAWPSSSCQTSRNSPLEGCDMLNGLMITHVAAMTLVSFLVSCCILPWLVIYTIFCTFGICQSHSGLLCPSTKWVSQCRASLRQCVSLLLICRHPAQCSAALSQRCHNLSPHASLQRSCSACGSRPKVNAHQSLGWPRTWVSQWWPYSWGRSSHWTRRPWNCQHQRPGPRKRLQQPESTSESSDADTTSTPAMKPGMASQGNACLWLAPPVRLEILFPGAFAQPASP